MRERFEQMRAQFDTNGDGELDESERQAMREEMQRRFGGGREGGFGGGREGRREGGGQRQPQ
jgi:hypothetical protein